MKNLKNKIYQMFILGFEGEKILPEHNIEKALSDGLGGVIFFTKNIQNISQTKKLINNIKNKSLIKPFISIDEEGGRVERTENLFGGKKFLSARYQGEKGIYKVISETDKICQLLFELGFNMNFAPVLDVDSNPKNPIIAERSYGKTTEDVIQYGLAAIRVYINNFIIPVVKHFPGHGDANVDSHLSLPKINLSLEYMERYHISPFEEAVKLGVPAIMVAHLHCLCFDKKPVPASLSKSVIKNYLISQLGFKGVVVSDDMMMGALAQYNPFDALIQGINAGINLFIYRDSNNKIIDLINQLYEYAQKDENLQQLIEISYSKIMNLKKNIVEN